MGGSPSSRRGGIGISRNGYGSEVVDDKVVLNL